MTAPVRSLGGAYVPRMGYDRAGANDINGEYEDATLINPSITGEAVFDGTIACEGILTTSVNDLVTTPTDGFVLQNETAATSEIAVQASPRLRLSGTAWNSVSGLSETDDWFVLNLPSTVAGTTTTLLKFGATINGGAATYPMTVSSAGALTVLGLINAGSNSVFAGGLVLSGLAALTSTIDGTLTVRKSDGTIGVMFDARVSGVLGLRDYANTVFLDLVANSLQSKTIYTVGTLPAASAALEGSRRSVSDALGPVAGDTVVGGGAVHVPVYCDGTNWVVW